MKHLNDNSTRIFCLLMDKMGKTDYLKIENEPYMPLSIERIGEAYNNEAGVFSLSHSYAQNGDLMRDPEVCFIVVDHREETEPKAGEVQITPYSFRQDNLGLFEESMFVRNGVIILCHDSAQHEQTEFADEWLNNIELQGFLNQL